MPDNEIVLHFKRQRPTKNKILFDEVLGDQAWSSKDIAVGSLYVMKETLEMIGNPDELEVTIRPKEK